MSPLIKGGGGEEDSTLKSHHRLPDKSLRLYPPAN